MHASRDAQPVLNFLAQAADPVLNPDLQLHIIRPHNFQAPALPCPGARRAKDSNTYCQQ